MSQLPAGTEAGRDQALAEGDSGPNPILMVHRALRGRYLIAALLGAVFAVPGGILGFVVTSPTYTSNAVLEASPTLPALLYENELNQSMPAFDAFVAQQATSLRSERVLLRAIDSEELRATGWQRGADGLIRLRDSLSVQTPRRSNQVVVSVSDGTAETARLAAKAVLDSYETIRREYELLTFGERERQLEDLRDEYQRQRDERSRLALDRALNVAGTEDLELAQRQRLERLSRIEADIANAEANLARFGSAEPLAVLLDAGDAQLVELQDDLDRLQRLLDTQLQYLTREHREVKWIIGEISVLEARIQQRTQELAGAPEETNAQDEPVQPLDRERELARAALEDLERARQETQTSLERIARTRLDVLALQQEAAEANARFEDAERRLESLRVEKQSQIVGRVRVAQEPERPLQPTTDRRRPLAAAGFMAGGGAGVALVAAFGFFFPRLRVADDVATAESDFAMLGIIPTLPDHDDGGIEANFRDSFHFLRVMLDARTKSRSIVASVTSPSSGDGKTTVALNLARSFANARRRVLLIDADLVGRGMTRLFDVESVDVDHHGAHQLSEFVTRVGSEAFDFIPAADTETGAAGYCGQVLHGMLETAREQYDVVLIDTGPILGSIEAAAVTPAVDQVLLVASRGQESRLLKMSTTRLRELHARSVGVIFNRATSVDFERSFSPKSSVSRVPRGQMASSAPRLADTPNGRHEESTT